ncbi:MAG TPA: hypothetical protein VFZ61_31460 [Polyangiales bacterium]
MRMLGNASLGAVLGLWIGASAACAEQHQADSSEPIHTGDDVPGSSDAPAPNASTPVGAGVMSPAGMVSDPPKPGVMVSTPPASTPLPGAPPAQTPGTLPEPEPFDPMRTACGSPRASEGVWLAFTVLNHACSVDEDCFVSAGAVSCSRECARGSLNVAERANASRWFAAVEDRYCKPYRTANCPVLAPANCSSEDSLPRCKGGYCSSVTQRCDAGCTPERPGGECRGAERCDGCPSVLIEADGQPCRKPGQRCILDTGCSPWVDCKDDKQPGVFRWVLVIPLC